MTNQDRNFNDLAERFEQRIYGSGKGQLREALLWWHMESCYPAFSGDKPMRFLDAGGGLGQMTQRLLDAGHEVVLNDISHEMLAKAKSRLPTTPRLAWYQGPVQGLPAEQVFDGIVCHAMLEWLESPEQTLHCLLSHLKPGGILSLAFYNRHSLVIKHAKEGNVPHLLPRKSQKKYKPKGLSPINPQYPEDVLLWLATWGFETLGICGVRVLYDWLPKATLAEYDTDTLLVMEKRYALTPPFTHMGRYFHGVFRKPHDLSDANG